MLKNKLLPLFLLLSFAIQAHNTTWTIVKTKPQGEYQKRRVGSFWAGVDMKINLGKAKPGTLVYPLQVSGDVYQVQLENGQIRWVYFTMLKETQKMEMTKATALYERKGSSSYRMGKFLDSLKQGDVVNRIGISKGGGVYFVKTEKGKKGAVIRQYAKPIVESLIPKQDRQNAYKFILRKNLKKNILNKSDSNLKSRFGKPSAIVVKGERATWYYTEFQAYENQHRYQGISFMIENGFVVKDSLLGKGESYFIDHFPLYLTIKASESLDILKNISSESLLFTTNNWHWTAKFLFRIVGFILFLFILSLAHFTAYFITLRIAKSKKLSLEITKIIGYVLSIILNYLYFLFVVAHIIREEVWLTFILMSIILFQSLKKISRGIDDYVYLPNTPNEISEEEEVVSPTPNEQHKNNIKPQRSSKTKKNSYQSPKNKRNRRKE